MAAAVKAKYALTLTVDETVASGLDNVVDQAIPHTLGAHAATLDANSTPAVTKVFSDTINLVAGAGAIDLTSLAGPSSTTVTFNGLKVQLVKLACPSTNTAGITVDRAAATPYNLFGADNVSAEQVEILPGAALELFNGADQTEDVDATHKDVQLVGTGTETIQVLLVAG